MAKQQARRPWSRTAIIIAAAALVGIGIGIAVVALTGRTDEVGQGVPASTSPPAAPMPSTTGTSVSTTPDDVTNRGADGCLGGSDAYTAVLTAQQDATIDDPGAAAFGRAVARWALAFPSDPNSTEVLAALEAPNSGWAEVAAMGTGADNRLRKEGFVSARIESSSRYRVVAPVVVGAAPPRRAVVQTELTRVLVKSDGSEESAVFKTELVLREKDGVWSVVGTTPEALMQPETPRTPWVLYSGGC